MLKNILNKLKLEIEKVEKRYKMEKEFIENKCKICSNEIKRIDLLNDKYGTTCIGIICSECDEILKGEKNEK